MENVTSSMPAENSDMESITQMIAATATPVASTEVEYMYAMIPLVLGFLFLFVGPLSNAIAAFALWPRMKKISTFNYLLVMAAMDTIYIFTYNLVYAPAALVGFNIYSYMPCSFINFLLYVPAQISSWCLVACCVERALIVQYPTEAKDWFSPRRARIALIYITIVIITANWHLFGGLKTLVSAEYDILTSCEGRTIDLDIYLKVVYPWVDMGMYSLVPASIIIICTTVIISNFIKGRKTYGPVNVANITMHKVSLRTTRMSVALAATFLVNTLPFSVSIIFKEAGAYIGLTEQSIQNALIAAYIFMGISLSNHCLNLYIYMAFSEGFRADIKKILKCR